MKFNMEKTVVCYRLYIKQKLAVLVGVRGVENG